MVSETTVFQVANSQIKYGLMMRLQKNRSEEARTIFALLLALLSLRAVASDSAERIKVVQVLQPTGRACETYYSLRAAGIACLKDVEYKRLFRVTYRFAGEVKTADLDWYPEKKFAVTEYGVPIDPDTSNQFKTEHDRN